MVLLFFFSHKNAKDFIFHHGTSCLLVFQLHHIYNSVSSLQHVYCAVLSSFNLGIMSYFKLLHHRLMFSYEPDPFGMILIHLVWIAQRLVVP